MKFKSLLAALVLSVMFCVPAQAQDEMETRHEIGISYGTVPNSVWIDAFTDVVTSMFGEKQDNQHYVGPIGLEYYYHTSKLVGVGAVAVFASHNEDTYLTEKLDGHRTHTYYTLMPSVKFNWLRKAKWGMYSKLALGATMAHACDQDLDANGHKTGEKITTNDVLFNFQASLLGVEVGNQQVRGFLELGVGEQGIALAGVRYKF